MKRRALALVGTITTLLVACGSSNTSSGGGGGGGDEASKSVDQIVADAIAAMRQVKAAHVHGTVQSGAEASTIDGITEPDSSRVTITSPSTGALTIIVTGGQSYAIQGGQTVLLSGDTATEVKSFTINKLADCAAKEHGKLSKGDPTTINGHHVIPILDDGSAPGSQPGTTFVSLDGPPVIIRQSSTGRTTPGGSLECGHSQSSTSTSSGAERQIIDWDYPSEVPVITAPPGAVPV